jgi:hypothetical protein
MAIQFPCPGCRQPIEIDDAWADQQVGCPYCKRVVTAPASSPLNLSAGVPIATAEPGTSTAAPDASVPAAIRRRAPLGIFAMLVAMLAMGAMLLFFFMFTAWMEQHIDEETRNSLDMAKQQQAVFEVLKARSDEAQRFVPLPMLACFGGLLAVVLGIAGLVRNDSHKAWPISAIIIGVLVLPCGCSSALVPYFAAFGVESSAVDVGSIHVCVTEGSAWVSAASSDTGALPPSVG